MTEKTKTAEAIEELGKRELGEVKVLMIEDDPLITDIVTAKLSAKGCIPYSTVDSREAIQLATQFKPDVIILDLMLPEMPGEEVLALLKEDDVLRHIPVIVFSNKSDDTDIEKVMKLGAVDYMTKATTDINDLANKVKNAAKTVA